MIAKFDRIVYTRAMDDIKRVVGTNLHRLRKKHKLTQLEFAEKINYSDKAISRWENGDVVPDVPTLKQIADIYNIKLASLFDESLDVEEVDKFNKTQKANKMAITLLVICFIWFAATIIYIYSNIVAGDYPWQVFIYSLPITFLVALVFNHIWGDRKWNVLYASAFVWTTILSVYITYIEYNMWMIFILGVPAQIALVLWTKLKMRA